MATALDLYTRGAATLLAAWEEYARGSAGAAVRRLEGVSAAVFPCEPERAVYNNALLDRAAARRARTAVDAWSPRTRPRSTVTPPGSTRPTRPCARS